MRALSFPLRTRRDTTRLGQRIADAVAAGDLVLLSGDLGAGKTFLARAFARSFGVSTDMAIASPTFTLVQEYETSRGMLLHVDLYRLRDEDVKGPPSETTLRDVRRLGLAERRAEGAVLVVEWGTDLEAELGGAADLVVSLSLEADGRVALLRGEDRVLAKL